MKVRCGARHDRRLPPRLGQVARTCGDAPDPDVPVQAPRIECDDPCEIRASLREVAVAHRFVGSAEQIRLGERFENERLVVAFQGSAVFAVDRLELREPPVGVREAVRLVQPLEFGDEDALLAQGGVRMTRPLERVDEVADADEVARRDVLRDGAHFFAARLEEPPLQIVAIGAGRQLAQERLRAREVAGFERGLHRSATDERRERDRAERAVHAVSDAARQRGGDRTGDRSGAEQPVGSQLDRSQAAQDRRGRKADRTFHSSPCGTPKVRPDHFAKGCAMRVFSLIASAALAVTFIVAPARASVRPAIAFVPIDDRPVTYQLPRMLGAIAGIEVRTPPHAALGNFLTPGDPDAVWTWLLAAQNRDAFAYVVSTDMLAYGGLIASRTPSTAALTALGRIERLVNLRVERPGIPVAAFGTVMRLAPTGVAKIGAAANFFAAGATSDLIEQYARLPDPPADDAQRATAQRLRELIGPPLGAYLDARARNRAVDTAILSLAGEPRVLDRVVLGQDDAGTVGLHLRDVAALEDAIATYGAGDAATIESGTDELGMVLVAAAFARRAGWTPTVAVRYSRADGGSVQDPLELHPVDTTVDGVIASSGAQRVTGAADIDLFVRVTNTSAADEAGFVDAIARDAAAHRSIAVADLTFLGGSAEEQQALVRSLVERKIAASLDGFASWNTAANSLGTALPAAIAAGAGRRLGTFDAGAQAAFLLDRFIDDYGYRLFVRGAVNDDLAARGVTDHSYLLPADLRFAQDDVRSRLEPLGFLLLDELGLALREPAILTTLPWARTFEVWIDVLFRPR